MDQIVVKTEVQSNGEILVYYVDENGETQQGIITDFENSGYQIQYEDDEENENENYILNNFDSYVDPPLPAEIKEPEPEPEIYWSDEDTKKLLIFYTDNKLSFLSKATQRHHLWAVACKTMLIGKDQISCEARLIELKSKYAEVRSYTDKGLYVQWPYLDLCYQAFHDDPQFKEASEIIRPQIAQLKQPVKENTTVVKQITVRSPDRNVEKMLQLYLKYKQKFQQDHWTKNLWDTIALKIGTEDGEYWQKRFLNYKQHYIKMLVKKNENGPESQSVSWPYMALFDMIYKDDVHFHKKFFNTVPESHKNFETESIPNRENEWNKTHITVLGKYYIDSYYEFEDPTIPDMFLWTEIGRILDKKPENCKEKYNALRNEHLDNYLTGSYNVKSRTAVDIILDNIIARDMKKIMSETNLDLEMWETVQIDELVQFFYDNLEVFKDPICHFVCWEAISKKLKQSVASCKHQWDELMSLYNSILEDKKNDPEMQIDWRYIDIFDRIFDYGMDVNLFSASAYAITDNSSLGKVAVKKVVINIEKATPTEQIETASTEENITTPRTDPRSTKILMFYLKHKDKFEHLKNKLSLWEPLAKNIGMNTTQCAHRFRHLKQTYLEMVQKEIDQPKVTTTWPYYSLCKKVFGYRNIKNKMKQGSIPSDDWKARELKELIIFFSKNFNEINDNVDDVSKWERLANKIGKLPHRCKDKFVELRKCYRKLKTMKSKNPDVKISWTHFNMFDRIYSEKEVVPMDVEMEEEHLDIDGLEGDCADDDYQCIIVLQEGQDLSDIANGKIIIKTPNGMPQEIIQEKETNNTPSKWTKRTKKNLLIHYINYMRTHRGQKIIQKQLWDTIAQKMGSKTHIQCKQMFTKMKNCYIKLDESKQKGNPFHVLMEKVLKLKGAIIGLKEKNVEYKNVEMNPVKVQIALAYYLNHIDEFGDPKFEKKYLWKELAHHVSEPVNKVFNKINYMKRAYNVETEQIDGEKTEFSGLLNEIIVKEVSMNVFLDGQTKPFYTEDGTWSEDQIERLLEWYLSNLDKFKNPKFNRSYLWMEASSILDKSPVDCSGKMSEIRTQYRNMVKNNASELKNWRFLELCQKIYGTGKRLKETNSVGCPPLDGVTNAL